MICRLYERLRVQSNTLVSLLGYLVHHMSALLYTRLNTAEQMQGYSLDTQRRNLNLFPPSCQQCPTVQQMKEQTVVGVKYPHQLVKQQNNG